MKSPVLAARHHQLPAGAPERGPRPGRGPQRPGRGEGAAALSGAAPGGVGGGKSEMGGDLESVIYPVGGSDLERLGSSYFLYIPHLGLCNICIWRFPEGVPQSSSI